MSLLNAIQSTRGETAQASSGSLLNSLKASRGEQVAPKTTFQAPEPQITQPKTSLLSNVGNFLKGFTSEVKRTTKPALQAFSSTLKAIPVAVPTIINDTPSRGLLNVYRTFKGQKPVSEEQYQQGVQIKKEAVDKWEEEYFKWAMQDKIKAQKFLQDNPIEADNKPFKEQIKDPQWIGRGLTMNLPNFAATTAVGIVTGGVGVAPTGILLEGTNFYQDAREDGLNDKDATRLASGYGVLSGIIESLVPGELGEGKLITKALKGTLKKELISAVTKSGLEASTEIAQEILSNAFKKTYNENQDLFANWKEAGFYGALIGLVGDGSIRVLDKGKVVATGLKFKDGEITNEEESIMNPDEAIGKIANSEAKNTPQGKEIIRVALQAKQQNKDVKINTTGDLKVEVVEKSETNIPKDVQAQVDKTEFVIKEPTGADKQETKKTTKGEASIPTSLVESGLPKQFQEKINRETPKIKQLEADIKKGDRIPSIPVYKENGKYFTNKDGDNRLIAYKNLGIENIPVIIQEKTTLTSTQKQTLERSRAKKVAQEKTPSKIAQSIERKAIKQGLTKSFADVAGYDKITIEEQSQKASELISDLETARKVIRGEQPLPNGLRGTALITAAEEYIKKTGDKQLAFELANSPLVSETSAAAQELRLAAEREPDSLAQKLTALRKAKEEAVKKRTGKKASEAVKSEVKKIKEKIKKVDKYDWDAFVSSIEC